MDEAEKYRQRLETIAEKRRLQEEQDRARREMEDEKLRLQQLKRKSLRDQWLMEGAPLSPTSLDTDSPHSPLWGFQAQEIDKHMDRLQSESQQLAEEKDKLKEQMEDGQMKAAKLSEAREEMSQDVVVQNGENNAAGSETTEDHVKTNQSPLLNETAVVLTNGGRDLKADTNHSDSKQSTESITNGPICTTEGVDSMKLEPGLSPGVSEAEPGQVPNLTSNEEEEGGALVMRAKCVIITDEGDDVPEDPTPQQETQETMQSEESPLPKPEASKEVEEAVEGVLKPEAALETLTEPEKSEATEPTAEAQPAAGDGDEEDDIKTNESRDGDAKADGQDKQSDDLISVQMQSPANAIERATVASVPVYSEAQPSTVTPEAEAESEAAVSPEGAEAALKVQDPATIPDQFQEVPLADPQENQRTEARHGEQEPLLSQSKAHNTQSAPAAANSPVSTETNSPAGAIQGEETEAPNRKTCQCCSVM